MHPHAPSSVDFTTSSMASHTFSDRTAPPRAPSSVTSHSTKHTRRHHRSSRSHHGGGGSSSGGHGHASQNEFPNFAHTGDVEIVVASDGQERRYLLHRLILARCSGFFDASTSEQWSGQPDGRGDLGQQQPQESNDLLKPGGYAGKPMSTIDEFGGSGGGSPPGANQLQLSTRKRRPFWRYELDHGTDPDDIPMLVRRSEENSSLFGAGSGQQGGGGSSPQPRPPSAKSKPPASSNGFFRSITAMQSVVNAVGSSSLSSAVGGPTSPTDQQPMNDLVRDYDNMFRIFYNYPPDLDPLSITDAYIQSKTLLMLADMYDALEVVGPRIDHHLLQFQARLWKQIAKYPPSYLKLGYMARSKTIFGEALTHVVGQWPAGQMQLRSMPRPVLDLIEDKADDLDELRARLEGQLFRLTIVNSRGERAGPQSSVPLDWQAVSLFRHWLAENLPAPPAPILAGFGTTANPNPTGQKSVSFNPQTTTSGRPNSTHAPIPMVAESMLSASAGAGGGGGNANTGTGNTTAAMQSASATGSSVAPGQQPSMGHYAAGQATSQSSSGAASGSQVPRSSMIPSTGRAFRQLGLGGQAYLTHEELKKHLKQQLLAGQTYDKSLLRRFEKRVDDLKSQAQAVVRPLTRNALQMDTAGASCQYLTCAGVGEGEWPW